MVQHYDRDLPSYPKSIFEAVNWPRYAELSNSSPIFLQAPKMRNNPSKNKMAMAINGCSVGYSAANANTIQDIKEFCDNKSSGLLFKTYMDGLRAQLQTSVVLDQFNYSY